MTGALMTVLIVGLHAWLAVRPPRPRHSTPFNLQFAFGWWINELPVIGLYWLLSGTTAALQWRTASPAWWAVVVIGLLDLGVLAQLGLRMRFARPALSAAMDEAFGPGAAPAYSRPVWWRVLLVPFISWRPDVRRIAHRQYGAGRGRQIDLYVARGSQGRGWWRRPGLLRQAHLSRRLGLAVHDGPPAQPRSGAPVLLYLHSGGFRIGSKALGAKPMLYRLAAQGWVVASANYRLRADYCDQLADTRAAAGWLREHAGDHGGDPAKLFLAGGSAGAHLAATAALAGEQTVGVIGFYGYYGSVGPGRGPRSPEQCVNPAAPPVLIVHGTADTLVLPEDARTFAADLRAVSRQPVAYAEVPGMHHNFDFFHSPRFSAVIDTVERFAELVLAQRTAPGGHIPSRDRAGRGRVEVGARRASKEAAGRTGRANTTAIPGKTLELHTLTRE